MEYQPEYNVVDDVTTDTPTETPKNLLAERKPPIAAIMCIAVALFAAYSLSYTYSSYLASAIVGGYEDPFFLTYLAGAYAVPFATLLMTVGIVIYKKNLSALCGIGCILYMAYPLARVISLIISFADNGDVEELLWIIPEVLSFLPLALVALGCFLNKTKSGRVLRVIGGILLILLVLFSALYACFENIADLFAELTSYSPDTEDIFQIFRDFTANFNYAFWFDHALWMYLALMLMPSAKKA